MPYCHYFFESCRTSIIVLSILTLPKDFVDQSSHHAFFSYKIKFHLTRFGPFLSLDFRSKPIAIMYAARAAKPKLSLSMSAVQNSRPSLSLKSPVVPRTPISPSAASPTAKKFSSLQVPSYGYTNSCSSKSILKKSHAGRSTASSDKRIHFGSPTVHCVTPIENPDEYYGNYTKLTREERRWMVRE